VPQFNVGSSATWGNGRISQLTGRKKSKNSRGLGEAGLRKTILDAARNQNILAAWLTEGKNYDLGQNSHDQNKITVKEEDGCAGGETGSQKSWGGGPKSNATNFPKGRGKKKTL